jgi:hypothetical protein
LLSKTTILSDIVILTERSVGRISRRDFARDVSEILHCVQDDKTEAWTTAILSPKIIAGAVITITLTITKYDASQKR